MEREIHIDRLKKEAHIRWLKPWEILIILQNHERCAIREMVPNKPPSGSLLLFNRRVLKFFRNDGYTWQKKKDGRSGEGHERLKVDSVDKLNCYYAHGEENTNFHRRIYWILDPVYEHIVLVHYREVFEGRSVSGPTPLNSSTSFSQSISLNNTQDAGLTAGSSEVCMPRDLIGFGSGNVEVSSKLLVENYSSDWSAISTNSSQRNLGAEIRKLKSQLSLDDDDDDDDDDEVDQFSAQGSGLLDLPKEDIIGATPDHYFQEFGDKNIQYGTSMLVGDPGSAPKNNYNYTSGYEFTIENTNYLGNDTLSFPSEIGFQGFTKQLEKLNNQPGNVDSCQYPADSFEQQFSDAANLPFNSDQQVELETAMNLFQAIDGNCHFGSGTGTQAGDFCSGQNMVDKQQFTIREVSPEWAYSSESTKVIITGDFLSLPLEGPWAVMFGDTVVPAEIIQEGVLRCQTPNHVSGKVRLSITSRNGQPCSQIIQFEYRDKVDTTFGTNPPEKSLGVKSSNELVHLLRFSQCLLCTSDDNSESESDPSGIPKLKNEQWDQIIDTALFENENSNDTLDWLLEQLLKDRLQLLLSSRGQKDETTCCSLSKKEQGMIHLVSSLGYEWGLKPLLNSGVGINFRDLNGWTALHWAARFGREKMAAALLASGASPGAVTDPTSQDPLGKTAASIAESNGYRGLAGYLSEVSLTTHLSSIDKAESEAYLESADPGVAKSASDGLSDRTRQIYLSSTEEERLSLEDTLAAARNATQAAARIQAVFRAHSFRRRQQKNNNTANCDNYSLTPEDIVGISALSRYHDKKSHGAALCIQKKMRGWKGRKGFLTLRNNVVKIQAHVRGHQVRKRFTDILWTVSVAEKAILRWRRKGSGLRGFRPESEAMDDTKQDKDDNDDDDDILKAFRKIKVDETVKSAVSRVISMLDFPEARMQYSRVFGNYLQLRSEPTVSKEEASPEPSTLSPPSGDNLMSMLEDWLNME